MPSRRTAVAPTVEKILEAIGPAGLDQEQCDDLAVAVAEALSNAAVHGNRLHPGANVLIAIEVKSDGCAVVEIKDSGAGFDRSRLSDPTDNAHILMPGGRGVFLMRRLVDRLEYNPRGNCVRLTMFARNGHGKP